MLRYVITLAVFLSLLSCGNSGGSTGIIPSEPPYIYGELDSYSGSSYGTANVNVLNDLTGEPVSSADVRINNVLLAYDANEGLYQGNVTVAPGAPVSVKVTMAGTTYTASGTQFASYPTISSPISDSTWQTSIANTVMWSPGAPLANQSIYGLGVLDAGTGELVWPTYGYFQTIQTTASSYSLPKNSLSPGNRVVMVGIAAPVYFSNAAPGSSFYISGFGHAPVFVSDAALSSITVTPTDPSIAKGTKQQFTATGTFSDSKTEDLTTQATWASTDYYKASINSSGLASGNNIGEVMVTAALNGTTGFTNLTITPAVLVSLAVSPHDPVVFNGANQQFTAMGTFSDGTQQDVTSSVTWNSSKPELATISNTAGSNGKTAACASGTTTITATSGSISASTTEIVSAWTLAKSGTTYNLKSIVWTGSQFVAVGVVGTILTSPDGLTWTKQNSTVTDVLDDIVWTGTQFVVAGWGGMLTSPDGITWTARESGIAGAISSIAWSGTQLVAVGYAKQIITSPDGATWTLRVSDPGGMSSLYGVVWSGTQFVTVGYAGLVLTSPDGETWTQGSAGTNNILWDVAWSGRELVAVGWGASDTVLTSPDGITWTPRSSGVTEVRPYWYNVVWTGSKYVAVGGNASAVIISSGDGITWNREVWGTTDPLQITLYGVAAFGERFVAVGDHGTILVSP